MDHVHDDEIDSIACAIELSLLDLNRQNEHFVATDSPREINQDLVWENLAVQEQDARDEASSSYNYLDESNDEEDDESIKRAIEESLKPSNLSYDRRRDHSGNSHVCDVCDEPITTAMGRRDFWNQIICYSHWFDSTPICCGCTRFKGKEVEYIALGDGREICQDCHVTAILDDKDCRPLVRRCYEFFKGLNMKVREDIPFYLVDKHEMARLTSDGLSTGPVHPNSMVRGLTILDSHSIEDEESAGKRIKVEHSKHKGHGCGGIIIAVLSGLPKIMTGAILAHEMMHAWLRLQNAVNLELEVEEGICQVIGRKWLDWFEAEGGGRSSGDDEQAQFAKNLMKTFKHELEMDSSKAYGEGFRDAQWAVAKYGFQFTINHIVTRGTLPHN